MPDQTGAITIAPIAVDAAGAGRLLGISRSAFYAAWSAAKTPEGAVIGKKRIFSIDELKSWLAEGCPPRSVWLARKTSKITSDRLNQLRQRAG